MGKREREGERERGRQKLFCWFKILSAPLDRECLVIATHNFSSVICILTYKEGEGDEEREGGERGEREWNGEKEKERVEGGERRKIEKKGRKERERERVKGGEKEGREDGDI